MQLRIAHGIVLSLLCCSTALPADYATSSGQELYARFCSSCHGAQGHGDGPVAAAFTVEVPDLTLIARRAGGVFPRDRIVRIVDGRSVLGAHGSRTMPVWGEDLGRLHIGDPAAPRATQLIVDKLADHLLVLQRPALK